MEYLVLAGNGVQASLAESLGDYAPFFWSVIAPVGLAILWVGGLYTLYETWFGAGSDGDGGGSLFFKLVFGLILIALILGTGASLEFLLLGEGLVHARVLAGVVNLFG